MNILIDVVPSTLTIGSTEYPIRVDFRTWILFEQLLQDEDIPDEYKLPQVKTLLFDGAAPPEESDEELTEQILLFYRAGKDEKVSSAGTQSAGARIYDYDYDDDYIYAAFLQQYRIDLQTVDYLHWWQFRALFASLQDCRFVEIMGYRSMIIPSKMPAAEKTYYRKMKKMYALPRLKSETDKINEIDEMLMQRRAPKKGL